MNHSYFRNDIYFHKTGSAFSTINTLNHDRRFDKCVLVLDNTKSHKVFGIYANRLDIKLMCFNLYGPILYFGENS